VQHPFFLDHPVRLLVLRDVKDGEDISLAHFQGSRHHPAGTPLPDILASAAGIDVHHLPVLAQGGNTFQPHRPPLLSYNSSAPLLPVMRLLHLLHTAMVVRWPLYSLRMALIFPPQGQSIITIRPSGCRFRPATTAAINFASSCSSSLG